MQQPVWNYEQEPFEGPHDETDINLRAYFDRMPDEKLRQYRSAWTDQQVLDWDENFRDDGCLMLACSERDVEITEYRRVLEDAIRYRDRVRASVLSADRRQA